MTTFYPGCCGLPIDRRSFLVGAGAAMAAALPVAWWGWRGDRQHEPAPTRFSGKTTEVKRPRYAMPGPFPGRVIEVRDPTAVRPDHSIDADVVRRMVQRGMCELTGADDAVEAWRRFFEKDDIVGIKVNPVGRKRRKDPKEVGSISSPELLLEIVAGLKSAGVPPRNIIVFERYANEFREAGYEKVMRSRPMDGVRWHASASAYDHFQVDIEGYDKRGRRYDFDRHVVGYDPDVFVEMGFAQPDHDPKDDRRFRSHLSLIVTKMVNKIITIPVLKDHRSAGVTLALKNMSHGFNNNVARSHISTIYRLDHRTSNPNQCNTFIPLAAGQEPIRQKATLHIMDGLIGVYEGGPGSWNRTWSTWHRQSLFFATDPVALDHVGWDIIDAKRAEMGWPGVAQMGLIHLPKALSARLTPLAAKQLAEALALLPPGTRQTGIPDTEQFDRRQPEHVILAETIGLGVFNAAAIEHRQIRVTHT
ncbi:MAG: hypothetical protein KatS3mg105_2674 [Gemmatales bacterium]|nr:MAG: hypothetical protein KatS3mg105_2674 [Gemmatales bacterium]